MECVDNLRPAGSGDGANSVPSVGDGGGGIFSSASSSLMTTALVFLFLLMMYFLLELNYFVRMFVSYTQSKLLKKRLHILDAAHYGSICLTTDVDILLFHMNNARYLREVDFARADFYSRTGLWHKIRERGASVYQGATFIRYRRFIRLFARYTITTKIVYWDESAIYTEHQFITVADKFVRAIVYGKQSLVRCNVDQLMDELLRHPPDKKAAKQQQRVGGDVIRRKPECPLEVQLWMESTMVSSRKLRAFSI